MAASPTPAATDPAPGRPSVGLLIYDGDCGFCSAAALWFAKRTDGPSVGAGRIAPWQSLKLADYGLGESEAASAVQWFDGERCASGADAVIAALSAMRSPWSALGRVARLAPLRAIARRAYPVVAANRHRLPGAATECRIDPEPTPNSGHGPPIG